MPDGVNIRFAVYPTIRQFFNDDTFTRGLMGPFGSGKSSACVMEILRRAKKQRLSEDGIRHSRWVVVRNTYRELKDTTLKTFMDWFPPDSGGKYRVWSETDKIYTIRQDDIELEVLFRALDRPDDVKKLLSLELTGAWVNEAREVPLAIVEGLQGRVGRYPSVRAGGASWFGVIMDTNPPDEDHWWYRMFEEVRPSNWRVFRQPSGRSPDAENAANLPAGYYSNLAMGKQPEWRKVYIDGEYGFVAEGKSVYPEFMDSLHTSQEILQPIPGIPVIVGVDFGLTPSAAFIQMMPSGQVRCVRELVTEGQAGITRFGERISEFVALEFPGVEKAGMRMIGDPAGTAKSQTDERTCFEILDSQGFNVEPAHTNTFTPRREAVASALSRLIDGQPGFFLSPCCKTLRKGFNGGYAYRRMQVPGEERFTDVPDKNRFSHPHDALQYAALGVGLLEALTQERFSRQSRGPSQAERNARRRAQRGRTAWSS